MLVFNQVCLALDMQPPIVEATINDSMLGDYIKLSCHTKMLMYYQAYLLLQGQLPMVGYIITDSVLGDYIEIHWIIMLVQDASLQPSMSSFR